MSIFTSSKTKGSFCSLLFIIFCASSVAPSISLANAEQDVQNIISEDQNQKEDSLFFCDAQEYFEHHSRDLKDKSNSLINWLYALQSEISPSALLFAQDISENFQNTDINPKTLSIKFRELATKELDTRFEVLDNLSNIAYKAGTSFLRKACSLAQKDPTAIFTDHNIYKSAIKAENKILNFDRSITEFTYFIQQNSSIKNFRNLSDTDEIAERSFYIFISSRWPAESIREISGLLVKAIRASSIRVIQFGSSDSFKRTLTRIKENKKSFEEATENRYKSALAALASGNEDVALNRLRSLLNSEAGQMHQNSHRFRYWIAEILYKSGKVEEALNEYKLVKQESSSQSMYYEASISKIASLLESMGKKDEACIEYQTLSNSSSKNVSKIAKIGQKKTCSSESSAMKNIND